MEVLVHDIVKVTVELQKFPNSTAGGFWVHVIAATDVSGRLHVFKLFGAEGTKLLAADLESSIE